MNFTMFVLASLAIFVLLIYAKYYWQAPVESYVIQSDVAGFRPDMLPERQLIVIEDRVVDALQFCRVALKYQYIHDRVSTFTGSRIHTSALVTLLSPLYEEGREDEKFQVHVRSKLASADVTFSLRGGQILLIPPHWDVQVRQDDTWRCVEAYDITHAFFRPLQIMFRYKNSPSDTGAYNT